jgi:anaerobic magnesium-protoporphyrin IX monomethyl ester cyclase
MRICICTTPIRPTPTTFPPLGSMAIIQALRAQGHDVSFFNIDYFRPDTDAVEQFFRDNRFDLVGISAVVSTAYAYTKILAALIKKAAPETLTVVGGNLAASAEILLRKCAIDYCVVGDGELIICELVAVVRESPRDLARLRETRGICFLGDDGEFVFTGYGARPGADEISWPDYSILEDDGSLPYFLSETIDDRFRGNNREAIPGERAATVVMTKGCVARCTFCHRFEKGFRARPALQVLDHVRQLKERYHVAYVDVGDENFGSDAKVAREIAMGLGSMGITWRVAGVRSKTVTREALKLWKENGCVSVIFGTESGSQTILDIMEKGASAEDNLTALQLTSEIDLGTVVQMVIGMPGETDRTINETIAFLKTASAYLLWARNELPSDLVSINYAQALPGTPLYEYAREHGFIGTSCDEEEKYLIAISDINAAKSDHFLNFTGQPMLNVLMWRYRIKAEIDADFLMKQQGGGLTLIQVFTYYSNQIRMKLLAKLSPASPVAPRTANYLTDTGRFNLDGRNRLKLAPLLMNPVTRFFFPVLLAAALALHRAITDRSPGKFFSLLAGQVYWRVLQGGVPQGDLPTKSLRKTSGLAGLAKAQPGSMIPLRVGR